MLCVAGVVDDFVVVIVGRWICYINGWWDFKMDFSRMASCINCKNVTNVRQLEENVAKLYGLCRLGICVELSYWFDDILVRAQGLEIPPNIIRSNGELRAFLSLTK